jgi:hypothetical protein
MGFAAGSDQKADKRRTLVVREAAILPVHPRNDQGQRLPVGVAQDEAWGGFFDDPTAAGSGDVPLGRGFLD